MVASGTLHWLVPQSIFLARVELNRLENQRKPVLLPELSVTTTGLSCMPIFLSILSGFLMLIAAVAAGSRKLASDMPVVGHCSVTIAAACHPPTDDVGASTLPVMLGEVVLDENGRDQDVGHATFTSKPVLPLVPGKKYI